MSQRRGMGGPSNGGGLGGASLPAIGGVRQGGPSSNDPTQQALSSSARQVPSNLNLIHFANWWRLDAGSFKSQGPPEAIDSSSVGVYRNFPLSDPECLSLWAIARVSPLTSN